MSRVLVLAPHTDDGELGCGATISNLIRNKHEVFYVAFSSCKGSLPPDVDNNVLVDELYDATRVLGVPHDNVIVLDFRVRYFERDRQDILEKMIELKNEISPDVVFSPSPHDVHQDHYTIANECMRAFKLKTILQYEVPWNNYSFDNQIFYCVDEIDVVAKINAVKCYLSQKNRKYTSDDFLRGNLLVHGVQIGKEFAEVFETPHMVVEGGRFFFS